MAIAAGTIAQDSTFTTLTFKDAVKIGLENNLNLNQQKNLLISNRVDKTSGLLSFGPSVAINGNTGRNDGNSFNQQQGRVINGVLDFTNASIDANMPLFRGLSVMNNYRQASSLYEAQWQNVSRTNQDVIRDIARQYLTCLLDQRLVLINEKNLESQQQQFNQISEQVSAGSRAEVDMKNQEYQVKNANLLLLRAKNTLRNDKAILAQTLQLDPSIVFGLEEPAWPVGELENLALDQKKLDALGFAGVLVILAAQAEGHEIVTVEVPQPKGDPVTVHAERPRRLHLPGDTIGRRIQSATNDLQVAHDLQQLLTGERVQVVAAVTSRIATTRGTRRSRSGACTGSTSRASSPRAWREPSMPITRAPRSGEREAPRERTVRPLIAMHPLRFLLGHLLFHSGDLDETLTLANRVVVVTRGRLLEAPVEREGYTLFNVLAQRDAEALLASSAEYF